MSASSYLGGVVDSLVGWAGFLNGEGQPVLASHPLSQPTNTRASTAMPAVIPPMQPPLQLNRGSSSITGLTFSSSGPARVTVMVGTSSTVTPSAVEASAAVPKLEESEVCTASAVVEAGTAMVAVMRTLAAATRIVTSDWSTPAALATFCCKLDLSLSV